MKVPHIFVILFLMIALASLVSYIIPAGQFERVANESGAEIIQPGTFEYIEASPVTFFEFMFAIPDGFIQTAEIIFGIIMIGGMFAVIERTGVISLAVNKLASKFSDKGLWIIPTLMIPFALFTTFTGQVEMSLIYLPAILPLVLKLGFDRITATAIVLVATISGFTLALAVPANLGVAQEIAELPLYSGMWYRIVLLAIVLTVGMAYVWRYARKVQKNPELSIVFDENDDDLEIKELSAGKATKRQMWTAVTLLVGFGVLLFGLLNYGWYFRELTGLYALIGIAAGLVAGLSSSEIADAFNEGFKKILLGAIVVGIARGIAVVLDAGDIMDTIIYALGEFVGIMPDSLTAVFMLIVQAALNFLIPSGSGQAMVTMPIMSGLSDISGVTRQTAVLAFLMGDGFTNIFYPTSGYFMATLAVGGVRWEKWLKFIFPLLIVWYLIAAAALVIAQFIDYGPL
ncbi:YfcC family protein [Microbacterium sp. APC 3898]|uniref:YfcC family protein n=1 Tax=Planococcus notacanthi TaxID=3035188 RepID=A0ABT7ZMP4_9BACL|nr:MULTISPECIES: YfcC family protein [Terrabacteria group]MDN3428450.1 YfcC family protein [Planococcus sp. APC 4016]MDN3498843.1 YfcC family protein [Microbacterium sp. APC 3898]